ncbi:MAG TPA: hypothetical protein VEC99_03780 [Clostridia bacterium]|nr:hypothetical protein [Clostridia bacterium]
MRLTIRVSQRREIVLRLIWHNWLGVAAFNVGRIVAFAAQSSVSLVSERYA